MNACRHDWCWTFIGGYWFCKHCQTITTDQNVVKGNITMTTANPAGVPSVLIDGDDSRFAPVEETEAAMMTKPSAPRVIKRRTKRKIVRENHDNLIATVPHRSLYDNYIGRLVWGMADDKVFDFAFNNGHNILLKGPTGCGKTMATQAWAAGRDKPYFSITSSAAAEPQQLFGKWIPAPDGKGLVWLNGPVTDIFEFGGVLLINEVNFLPRAIASSLFSALDSRRALQLVDYNNRVVEAHRPEDCWCEPKTAAEKQTCRERWVLIVADMNPDYAGTWELNAAFQNRFAIQIDWDYEKTVEERLILSPNLVECAWKIREDSTGSMRTPVSTNMLIEFESTVGGLGWDFAVGALMAKFDPRDRTFVSAIWNVHSGNIISDYTKEGLIND